ncbi:MAG: hypothetical protein M1816_006901 [Peltula sp. TS41687]|nr:MAG: hypothetical protein M1816_006901 [Peltula sp. TS41687]
MRLQLKIVPSSSASLSSDHRPLHSSWSPSTSWLLFDGEDNILLPNPSKMKSNFTADIAMLAEKRTLRFAAASTTLKPALDDQYQSLEEDWSSGEDGSSEMSVDAFDFDFIDFPHDDPFGPSKAIDAHVARIITFIAPGKPRLIDINTFSPVMEPRVPVRQPISKPPEARMKRRIRESREMDRILKSRSWISKAFGHDDPYVTRRSIIPPLDDIGSPRSLQESSSAGGRDTFDPLHLPRYSPTKFAGAHLKLRGVARSLIAAKRKSSLPEGLC